MGGFLRFAVGMDFLQELLVAALLFLLPLKKRRLWGGRFALGAFACILASYLIQLPLSARPMNSAALPLVLSYLLFQLGAVVLVFWHAADLSLYDALYGTICAYAVQHFTTSAALIFPQTTATSTFFGGKGILPLELPFVAALYGIFYLLVARRLPEDGQYRADVRRTLPSLVLVLSFAMVLSLVAKFYGLDTTRLTVNMLVLYGVCILFDLLCCGFVLWGQISWRRQARLEALVESERRLRQQQRQQYQLSRESIELINRKCHDLKHQVAALRCIDDKTRRDASLDEIERSVMIYDSAVNTGNEVLDTVLTEKSLACERDQIRWTCMAEGAALDFMDPIDLYTLFGNALDNAMENVRRIRDPEKRILAVTLQKKRDLAFLQIENYCDRSPELRDGLPVSTKPADGNHGFGVKSIREIVTRYGGTMDLSVEDGIFLLCILLPLP